jgi:hypothetical protein
VGFTVAIRIQGKLGNPFTVTQVDKYQSAVIAAPLNPSHQADLLADKFTCELATVVAAFPLS